MTESGNFHQALSKLPHSARAPRQLAGSAIDLMEASSFRSLEAVNGARSRAASGGRRPLTASRLRKFMLP